MTFVPRFVLAGFEAGPAVDLAAGALVAAFARRRVVRPVLLGLDLPLWRLLYGEGSKAPRVLDPALHNDTAEAELIDYWTDGVELLMAADGHGRSILPCVSTRPWCSSSTRGNVVRLLRRPLSVSRV